VAGANRSVVSSNKDLADKTEENTDAVDENTESQLDKLKKAIKNSAGEIGDIAEGFAEGGLMGAIVSVIGKIIGMFEKIENVSKVMNPITTIFERMIKVIEPIVNQFLAPFVIILEKIGEIIGSILAPVFEVLIQVLHPVLNVILTIINTIQPVIAILFNLLGIISKLEPIMMITSLALELLGTVIAFLYNYTIRPVINAIIFIIGIVVNAIAAAVNFIIGLLNKIPGVNIREVSGMDTESMYLQKIDAVSSGNTSYDQTPYEESKASGGSGSYSAAKDVIVNIYFNSSFVNGDAREIALALERELESAHALGY
jgi:hypothetical protein